MTQLVPIKMVTILATPLQQYKACMQNTLLIGKVLLYK